MPMPSRLPWRWVMPPIRNAARAEPRVNSAVGTPARSSEPSISWASNAPTVIPAANPAPPSTCPATTTASTRRCKAARAPSSD